MLGEKINVHQCKMKLALDMSRFKFTSIELLVLNAVLCDVLHHATTSYINFNVAGVKYHVKY